MTAGETSVSLLLEYLVREADLDGLATFRQSEAAERIGRSRDSVKDALKQLSAQGIVSVRAVRLGSEAWGGAGTNYTEVRLLDEVAS